MDGEEIIRDRLRRQLVARAAEFAGVLAVTVIDPIAEHRIDVNAHVRLGCGSSIKIPILMELYRQHAVGELDLDRPYPIAPENRVGGAGILQFLHPGHLWSGRDLATAMIVLSDNTATNACIDLAGMPEVQKLLRELTPGSQLARKMQDYDAAARGVENVSTSADMAEWLRVLWDGRLGGRALSDDVLKVLGYPKDGLLNRALGPPTKIANKPGGLDGGKSDVGIIYLPRRSYIVSIMTAFVFSGNGAETVVEVARTVHEHMSALDSFKPMGVPHIDHFIRQGRAGPARPDH